jgi:hypothetical protein
MAQRDNRHIVWYLTCTTLQPALCAVVRCSQVPRWGQTKLVPGRTVGEVLYNTHLNLVASSVGRHDRRVVFGPIFLED